MNLNDYITEHGVEKIEVLEHSLKKCTANAHLLNQWQFFGIVETNTDRDREKNEREVGRRMR